MRKLLPKGRGFDSNYLVVDILREMEARIQEYHLVKRSKGMIVYLDSTPLHNSKCTVSETQKLDPCDF